MKASAQITFAMSLLFAALSFGYGAYGWYALGSMAPGPDREDAQGYIFFWAFLGAIGVVSAWIARRMMRAEEG